MNIPLPYHPHPTGMQHFGLGIGSWPSTPYMNDWPGKKVDKSKPLRSYASPGTWVTPPVGGAQWYKKPQDNSYLDEGMEWANKWNPDMRTPRTWQQRVGDAMFDFGAGLGLTGDRATDLQAASDSMQQGFKERAAAEAQAEMQRQQNIRQMGMQAAGMLKPEYNFVPPEFVKNEKKSNLESAHLAFNKPVTVELEDGTTKTYNEGDPFLGTEEEAIEWAQRYGRDTFTKIWKPESGGDSGISAPSWKKTLSFATPAMEKFLNNEMPTREEYLDAHTGFKQLLETEGVDITDPNNPRATLADLRALNPGLWADVERTYGADTLNKLFTPYDELMGDQSAIQSTPQGAQEYLSAKEDAEKQVKSVKPLTLDEKEAVAELNKMMYAFPEAIKYFDRAVKDEESGEWDFSGYKHATNIWAALPWTGERSINNAFDAMLEPYLRIKSGAATPQEELRRYFNTYKPSVFDSSETAARKLNTLWKFMKTYADMLNLGIDPAALPDIPEYNDIFEAGRGNPNYIDSETIPSGTPSVGSGEEEDDPLQGYR